MPTLYQAGENGYGSIRAAIGTGNTGTKQNPKYTGNSVNAVKLLAVATGEYTRDELAKDCMLGWTKAASDQIAAAKAQAEGQSGD